MQNIYTPHFFIKLVLVSFISLGLLGSCKKDKYKARAEARDSAYLITKDIYLWPEKLPSISSFKPRNSPDIYAVMEKVKTYQPLDKWSFAETKEETELSQKSSAEDFGFMVKFGSESNTDIRVIYVYSASSAGLAGVKRTWRVNKINGRVINRSVQADVDYINEIFFGTPSSAEFEFIKPDGTTVSRTLSKSTYVLNTVLYSNVFLRGTKKIGYFVYNQFAAETSVTEIVNTMTNFQNQGVNEVIVDLRYNRGGLVSTHDTLANFLAPKKVGRDQTIMYTFQMNQKYSSWNETNKFRKVGDLDLPRVVFIVSPSSASASELLINNLNPVMEVKLVGDRNTYGKPVGFFPIPVYEYNIYPVSFKTVNSAGKADFYSGFPVHKQVSDDLNHDFGDENEANLKEALYYITNNYFTPSQAARVSSVSGSGSKTLREANAEIDANIPSVTIENRPSRMPYWIKRLQQ